MNLLIVQNGYKPPTVVKYLDSDYTIVKSWETEVSQLNLDSYSAVIVLGGNQSLTHIEDYPYLYSVIILVKQCLQTLKPIIGICLGCQLLAYVVGCEIKTMPHKLMSYDIEIAHECWKNIFCCHYDQIVPNAATDVLSQTADVPYLIRFGLRAIGIQAHPDIDPEQIRLFTQDDSLVEYANSNAAVINKQNLDIMQRLLSMVNCREYD